MSLVEPYPCAAKLELEARESFYMLINVCVNKMSRGVAGENRGGVKTNEIKKHNAKYDQTTAGKESSKRASRKYWSSEKGKAFSKYKDRMHQQHGDRYCNSLLFISWDVFK